MNDYSEEKTFAHFVLQNRKPIYCAASLFSPLDRVGGSNLANAVEEELRQVSGSINFKASDFIFLPFRDTDQNKITGKDRSKKIYQLDIEQLKKSSAILARLDGLAKDSGVAMEIGFAYGLGIPIGILQTDFIWEGFKRSKKEWFINPILEIMSNFYKSIPTLDSSTQVYHETNLFHEAYAINQFVKGAFQKFTDAINFPRISKNRQSVKSIYIDIMGGRYEWCEREQTILKRFCEKYNVKVDLPKRYLQVQGKKQGMLSEQDIINASNASIAIFSGDSPEMDPGSAALFGLCKSRGVFSIFQFSSNIIYKGLGNQQMKVNLMIDQAADLITHSTQQTKTNLKKLIA